MRKIFLIPLMAMLCTVMAWADPTVRTAGTLSELQDALSNAAANDEIQLTADIALPSDHSVYLNIKKSITLDGQGHTLSGYGNRGSAQQTIAINYSNSEKISVVLKNLNITTPGLRPIDTRGNLISLELDNVNIVSTATSGNAQGITFSCDAGADASIADLIIKNSSINATASGYPIIFWNPANVIAENSTFAGYCGLYFKNGSRGSVVDADACNFDCPNVHSGVSNAFSCFPLADDGITLNLHNCGVNNQQIGDQNQALVTIGNDSRSNRREQPININISGDNSHINVGGGINKTFQNLWIWGPGNVQNNDFADINITITGGTYSSNPMVSEEEGNYDMAAYGHWVVEDEQLTGNVDLIVPNIPSDYEVQEVKQGDVTLYRVVKKAATYEDPENPGQQILYDLNDLVTGEGIEEGNNPVSSFDLSTGTEMELNQETTTAGYVQVSDNGDDATIIKVGKVEDAGTPSETKVDQTLVINNGLDVQGDSKVEVQAGSTVIIGEGGINTENNENIVIEADENGSASLLLNPDITVNQNPALTVKMETNVGKFNLGGFDYWVWHRFAMPMKAGATWTNEDVNGDPVATYFQGWNYGADDWATIAPTSMQPFYGYILTHDLAYVGTPGTPSGVGAKVTYIFKGNLVGNEDLDLAFSAMGWNFFGNSYTAYIETKTLLAGVLDDPNVGGTVYVWNATTQTYQGFSMDEFRNNTLTEEDAWAKEIAPMHTFILQKRAAGTPEVSVNYRSAIWGNPRYASMRGETPAPARFEESTNTARVFINVIGANGQSDRVKMMEDAVYTDAYDDGGDATKYMNQNHLNVYASMDEDYGTVATNNLAGKMLSLQTSNDINYTMTFDHLFGTTYAIKDMQTNVVTPMTDGNTYTFAAQPNSTIEGRFVIVPMQNMPTDVETVETTTAVKGIYTIMGQYVGETSDWETLPKGVYVVDGVKIIK